MPLPNIYIDVACEIHDILRPIAAGEFWDFDEEPIEPGAIYVIGRVVMSKSRAKIEEIIQNKIAHVIFSNPAEGSRTMLGQFHTLKLREWAQNGDIMIIAGSPMNRRFRHIWYDHFLHQIVKFEENMQCMDRTDEIYNKLDKPFKFLFLNGRMRQHRKWMLASMKDAGLLADSIYTNLDMGSPVASSLSYMRDGKNIMHQPEPIVFLKPQYELDRYKERLNTAATMLLPNSKWHLFQGEWGDAYIEPAPYIDTYFTVITETVFEDPYSFRTEKIWKPIIMGHPWIAVANAGFYRDIRNLGFKTFDGIIDESFDLIANDQERIERISQVIQDLSRSNLPEFLLQCKSICKYNQSVMLDIRKNIVDAFPQQFLNFLKEQLSCE